MSENSAPAVCGDDTCERDDLYAKGFCKNHYNQSLKRTGRIRKRVCAAKDCPRMAYSKYCSSHSRRKKAGDLDAPIQGYGYGDGCSIPGDCPGVHYAKGLCRRHYRQEYPGRCNFKQDSAMNNLRWKYGITTAERAAIEALQGGVCAICKEPPPEGKALVVDHDHAHCDRGSPKLGCRYCVRGLLCNTCNRWIEKVERNPELSGAVKGYLANPPAFKVIEREKPKRGKPFLAERELLQELGLRD